MNIKKGPTNGQTNNIIEQDKDTTIKVEIPAGTSLNKLPIQQDSTVEKKEDWERLVVSNTLIELMVKIQKVDFRKVLGLSDDEKPKRKNIVVLIVDEILEIAKKNDLGVAVQDAFIYVYNGKYWQPIDKYELKAFLAEAAEKMQYERLECRHHAFRDELYKQFLAVGYIPPPVPEEEVTLINLQNGTLEVTPKGFELREHKREDFLTYQLPFEYNPNADCPKFINYLEKVQPDYDAQKVLSEYVGYVFTNHLKLEKLLLLYGGGANGKSVFFDILNALLGNENISNYSLANLNEEHNRAMIVNKLLNYGSEIRGKVDLDILKQMASGEPIQARLKYGNSFITRRYAKLAFNCNELPPEVEHSEAYFRRFIILPFDVTIPEEERNPTLAKEIIAKELPGVLNWVLIGLERLLKVERFSECKKAKKALEAYRKESDSVALFLDESGYKQSIECEFKLSDLYQEYKSFCIGDGYLKVSNKTFAKRLSALGYETKKKNIGKIVFIEKISF